MNVAGEGVWEGGPRVVTQPPHDGPVLGLVLGRPQVDGHLARPALHLAPEAPPEGRGGTHGGRPERGVGEEQPRPSSGNRELEGEVRDRLEEEVELLPHAEGGRHAHGAAELVEVDLGADGERRGDVGVYGAPQELKGEPVDGLELDLAGGLVGGPVGAGVEHHVVQLQLPGHRRLGGVAPPLEEEGLDVVQLEHAGRGTGQEGLHVEPVQGLALQDRPVAVHQYLGAVVDVDEHLVDAVGDALVSGDGEKPYRFVDGIRDICDHSEVGGPELQDGPGRADVVEEEPALEGTPLLHGRLLELDLVELGPTVVVL